MRLALRWILFLLLLSAARLTAQPDSVCSPEQLAGLPSRLESGQVGQVTPGSVVNVRAAPGLSGERLARLEGGSTFDILAAPRCADGYVWWQIDDGAGTVGWVAEGSSDTGEYWLWLRGVPLDTAQLAANRDSRLFEREFVLTPDGFTEPRGCLLPPDDYRRIEVGRAVLNARTLFMLDHAQQLYNAQGGFIDFRYAITQGSYNAGGVAASFGTHDGGGALDLSVRSPQDLSVLTREIEPMIYALRVAGFAAWLREEDVFYPDSPIHIHAIAVGDAEASPAAREQVEGVFGYLNGFDGLPPEYGGPNPDPHDGALICGWMRARGLVGAADE
jgi:hypothetical protein